MASTDYCLSAVPLVTKANPRGRYSAEPEKVPLGDHASLTITVSLSEVEIRVFDARINFHPTARPLPRQGNVSVVFNWGSKHPRFVRCRILVFDRDGLICYADSHSVTSNHHTLADHLDRVVEEMLGETP